MPHTIYSRTPTAGHYGSSCGSCGPSCGCAPCKAQYGDTTPEQLQKKVLISVPVLLGVIGLVMFMAVKLEN